MENIEYDFILDDDDKVRCDLYISCKLEMSKPKELLIEFLLKCNILFRDKTGYIAYTCHDFKEILINWTEKMCLDFLNNMTDTSNYNINPWCYHFNYDDRDCSNCGYSIRHGKCSSLNSTFYMIQEKYHKYLCRIEGMKDLVNLYRGLSIDYDSGYDRKSFNKIRIHHPPKITYKEILIDFLKELNNIILKEIDIEYINEEDYDEIEKEWTEELCYKFLMELNIETNPWCTIRSSCICCSFGERHGRCDFPDSNYQKIKEKLNSNINNFTEVIELVDDFNTILSHEIKEYSEGVLNEK